MDHQNWTPIIFSPPDTQKQSEKEKQISQLHTSDDVKLEAPKSLGQLICTARNIKSKTQKQLAAELGISHTILSRWEIGKEIPTNANIAAIEKKLGIKLPRAKKVKVPSEDK